MPTSKEAITLAVIISLFVIVILYFIPHMQDTKGALSCAIHNPGYLGPMYATCCDTQTDKEGIEITWCTICNNVDVKTFAISDCGPRFQLKQGSQLPLPPPGHLNSGITFSPSNAGGNTSNPTNYTAMKATRGVYSPTGGCIPGGSK